MTIQRNRIWNCGRKIGVADEKRTKITVEIKDKEYTIVGTESKEHVEYVAHLVNDKMNEIHQANKHLDTSKLAVLTAINTMNEFVKLQEELERKSTRLNSSHVSNSHAVFCLKNKTQRRNQHAHEERR